MLNKEQTEYLNLLTQVMGVESIALERSGTSKETLNKWKENIFFLEGIKQVEERQLDYVENALFRLINEGNISAIQFYLKTKGKERGY
jgi:hypothetical protein